MLQAEDLSTLLPELYARSGDFTTMFARTAGLDGHKVVTVDLLDPQAPLPAPEAFAGVFISGSAAMVTDRAPWMLRAEAWIRDAARTDVPTLGICFGHQLIASALGGDVADAPQHAYETVTVTLTDAGLADQLLSVLPPKAPLQSAHSQIVTRLPSDAPPLAHADTGIYAARFAGNLWGVQFHPETCAEDMSIIIEDVRTALEAGGIDADAKIAGIKPSPDGPALMRRFRDIALGALPTGA
ncbi:hypothetical protein MNBD_ALPHA09-673 [hydrothermal vent metagenome]|uniref:Glutamine amidotransferase domain-containing protein n=1 Tax=hydrothermal vent metagenome TaxID=652676 RepID=A0A3B0SXZ4_9ZZZZ